jgi:hypothetical protein
MDYELEFGVVTKGKLQISLLRSVGFLVRDVIDESGILVGVSEHSRRFRLLRRNRR